MEGSIFMYGLGALCVSQAVRVRNSGFEAKGVRFKVWGLEVLRGTAMGSYMSLEFC